MSISTQTNYVDYLVMYVYIYYECLLIGFFLMNALGVTSMDKSWIAEDRDTLTYELGVEQFLIFAEANASNPKRIPCPCIRCLNYKKMSIRVIRGHLYDNGFMLGYKN